MAKYLGGYHGYAAGGGLRFVSAFIVALIFFNPITPAGIAEDQRPVLQIVRGLMLVSTTICNFLAFRYLQLDEALAILFATPFLVAIAGRAAARRMGRLAALDRDHGRVSSACWW